MQLRTYVVAALCFAGSVGCGSGSGPSPTSSQIIGPSGGTLTLADGTRIDVPAGALAQDTTITAAPVASDLPAAVGPEYQFGPEGQQFAVPVTVTLPYDATRLGDATSDDVAVFSAPAHTVDFADLPTVAVTADQVSATATHFSKHGAGVRARTPSASASTVVASPSQTIADGTSASTITVTVLNAKGRPVKGASVTLAATGTGNSVSQPGAVTDSAGVATGQIASTVAETKTITATINGTLALSQQPTVTFITGTPSAARSTVVAAPAAVAADGTSVSTITVTVRDSAGNPVEGATITLAATGASNTLVQPQTVTDAGGLATGTVASTRAETKTVTATVGGTLVLSAQPTVMFIAGPVDDAYSDVAVTPAMVTADGVSTSTITVTLRDANSNPIIGATVMLAATGSANTLTQPSAMTDSHGVATGSIASTRAGSKTITATVAGGAALGSQPTVTFVAGPPADAMSTVVASPTTLTADGIATSMITVTVRDATGNPVAAAPVTLSATGTGNSLNLLSSVTDGSGLATGTLASTVAESKVISATVSGSLMLSSRPAIIFAPGPIATAQSVITANPSMAVADGITLVTLSLTARDAHGNPVPAQPVAIAVSGTGNQLDASSGVTDASGGFSTTLSSTWAETKTVTATLGSTVLSMNVSFVAGPPVVAASSFTAAPTTLFADGVQTATLQVRLADAHGNPVAGQAVSLSSSGSSNMFSPASGATDVTGAFSSSFTSTRGEFKTVTVTAGSLTLTASIRFIAPACDGTFVFAESLPAGTNPGSVTGGDFNGDGNLDLAVSNFTDSTINVRLGNGDGTFQTASTFNAGRPASLTAVDVNGDGRLDLVAANFSGQVNVALGNGDGTFQAVATFPAGVSPGAVTVGDLNGDGNLDLATANRDGNDVSVLLGKGDGTFQPATEFAAGVSPLSVVAVDLNADGKLDLATANAGGNDVTVLLGNGDGTFQPALHASTGLSPYAVTSGDFNGDGKRDLATADNGSGTASVLLGNGDGTFQTARSTAAGTYPYSITAMDLDGDGRLDLATANYGSGNVSVLRGKGDGTMAAAINSVVGAGPLWVTSSDFNGDGKPDLAVANAVSNDVTVLLQTGCL